MTIEALRDLLTRYSNEAFVEEQLLGQPPWLFGTGLNYEGWLADVASTLQVQRLDIWIVGSAATGFSLSPTKPGRPFRHLDDEQGPSDIDIAIVDQDQFEQAWNVIVAFERLRKLRINTDILKLKQDIYWGDNK